MFHELTIFQKVYETRSITKAAKALFVTQPSVSVQLKKLEEELGVQLFIRNGNKGLIPTENANRFYMDSQIISRNWENSLNHLVKKHHSRRIRCVIGASPTTAMYVLPRLILSLRRYTDHFDFELITADSRKILDDIIKHEIDFGVLEKPFMTEHVEQTAFASDELVLAGDPENNAWLMGAPGSTQREYTEKYFTLHHLRPTHIIRVQDDTLLKQLVVMGIGKAIISKRAIVGTLLPYQQLSEEFHRDFYLLNPKIPTSTDIQQLINLSKTLLPQFRF
ncbi:LysR family transcriptional regulator [Lacticaseibacillus mingshuiensis]|uniref:LysR family transcriptional regulator n=1 Tax=Lacticaseibacillus mingshuiensis TaxID=2799574 RepID=A0ABW4CIK7_9LACO|nr:LysR family transcriptional regulator [Lacticaseibacillus mingshuiensis]